MAETHQLSLKDLPADDGATILSFTMARPETARLASLGFTPGARVDMAQNYGKGPLIVSVRGARVALGRGEAARILVEPILE